MKVFNSNLKIKTMGFGEWPQAGKTNETMNEQAGNPLLDIDNMARVLDKAQQLNEGEGEIKICADKSGELHVVRNEETNEKVVLSVDAKALEAFKREHNAVELSREEIKRFIEEQMASK